MNLRRILQLALTSFVGQGISIITQLLIPPFFLRFYPSGIQVYGEWIALSASINYLGTLNYGIQTYANNQMTILYNRGEVEASKAIQASALRLLGLLILTFCLAGLAVFVMPVASWLRLQHVSPTAASWTLYLLIIQMAVNMLFSLLTNSYMVVGQLHRGNYWASAQRLVTVLAMAAAIWRQASFPTLALIQLGAYFLFFVLVLIDVRRNWPILLPSLRYGSWPQTLVILKPSGHFFLIAMGGFLTWQGPVLVIQRILGPTAVATFALVRVVFQMSRQLLSIASGMVSQDITMLFGARNWVSLRRLYDLSERVVLFLIPIVSIGSLLMCPFLFTVWLHKRTLYEPLALPAHGHRLRRPRHQGAQDTVPVLLQRARAAFAHHPRRLHRHARRLHPRAQVLRPPRLHGHLDHLGDPPNRLRRSPQHQALPAGDARHHAPPAPPPLFMTVAFALAVYPAYRGMAWSLPTVVAVALLTTALFGLAAYFAFGLDEVRQIVESRIRRRFAVPT